MQFSAGFNDRSFLLRKSGELIENSKFTSPRPLHLRARCIPERKVYSQYWILQHLKETDVEGNFAKQIKGLRRIYDDGTLTQDPDDFYWNEIMNHFNAWIGKMHVNRGQASKLMWADYGNAYSSASFNISKPLSARQTTVKSVQSEIYVLKETLADTGFASGWLRTFTDE